MRRHGVIDSFLCDCPPATNYRDAEPQGVFNVHLTSFIYLAELTHKKGDFFLIVSKLVAHAHWGHTKTKELMDKNAVKHEMESISTQFTCLRWHKGEETPGSHCFNKQQLASAVAMGSVHEFGKYKAIMSKSHMFSCATSEKVWKEP